MANPFHLSVLTPEKSVLDQDVTYVQAPGMVGYFGVLASHAPLIAALKPGKLTVRDTSGTDTVYCLTGGFFEVSENQAVILADAMETPEEIDLDRARTAEQRARDLLEKAARDSSIDVERARIALTRSLIRQRVAGI